MIDSSTVRSPARIFLDAGVIIRGSVVDWGAPKAILVLLTLRDRYTVVLAEAIEREVQRAISTKVDQLTPEGARAVTRSVAGWFDRVRLERHPIPSSGDVRARLSVILPSLKHANDLEAVITAMQARPDWVISDNEEHWNADLAARSGLRIVTSLQFLRSLELRKES